MATARMALATVVKDMKEMIVHATLIPPRTNSTATIHK